MTVQDFIQQVKNSEVDIVEHTHKVIRECRKINKEYSYFNVISEELALKQANEIKKKILSEGKNFFANKKLLGVAISVKDAICVRGVESTAGSRILKGYRPLFNATVIEKAIQEGAIIVGKTAQDEFGFGVFSINTFNIPKNPIDKDRTCGGSSGGAAGIAKKAAFAQISLGESTGGSIVSPSSFCGVFGLCPTYGRVSRYGLMDFGNSLDKIGPIGKTCGDVALLQSVISGYDRNDSTSLNVNSEDYTENTGKPVKGMKIGIIKESFEEGLDKNIEKNVFAAVEKLKQNGADAEEVSMKMPIKYGIATYYMIATSEASTNLAKYCGMRYGASEKLEGSFNEYFTKVRSKYFTEEAKRRIMLGTFARMAGHRDAFYLKAAKVRTLMINEYKKAFNKFDALVSPTVPMLPPRFDEIEKLTPLQHYLADVMTVSPNVAGLPHLNVPVGDSNGLPVGMLLTGDHLQEGKLLQLGSVFDG